MIRVCGTTFAEASKELPGHEFFGMHINFSAEDFVRMLAKIGFCAAVATVGIGAFTNTPIRNVIPGNDQHLGHPACHTQAKFLDEVTGGIREAIDLCLDVEGAPQQDLECVEIQRVTIAHEPGAARRATGVVGGGGG